MNFAHEGSLRRTRTAAEQAMQAAQSVQAAHAGHASVVGYETVTTLSGRIQQLPGSRNG